MGDTSRKEERKAEGRSFLDLPTGQSDRDPCESITQRHTEIRLPIYHELLVSYWTHRDCTVKLRKATLLIFGSKNGVNPSTVGLFRLLGDKRTTYHFPHPAILSTCRQVAAEATPILYRENTFEFHFSMTNDLVPSPSAIAIRLLCIWLYNTLNSDNWFSTVPFSLKSCEFAAFLNAIGPINASTMTSLSFYGPDTDSVANCMPTITELVARHVPKLRDLEIHVASKMVWWDEQPDCFHPDRSSPFWANGAFWPLYRTLEDFVNRVTWLKRLEYKGQEDFCEFRSGSEGYERLKALEDQVKSRAGS